MYSGYINNHTPFAPPSTPIVAFVNSHKVPDKSALHGLPKVVCVEESGELWIDVDYMNIALATVSDNSLVVIASVVGFDVDSKGAIYFES